MATSPGRLGIGVFSPPLDARVNSVRGIKVCQAMSDDLGLHLFDSARSQSTLLLSALPSV